MIWGFEAASLETLLLSQGAELIAPSPRADFLRPLRITPPRAVKTEGMRFEAGWAPGALGLAEAACPQAGTLSPSRGTNSSWKELSSQDGILSHWAGSEHPLKFQGSGLWPG